MALLEPEDAKKLQDDIAATEALLDQAQAHYNKHKHLWTEEYAYSIQSSIDVKRLHLELAKLQFKMFETME
jgi:hypothetical protein